VICQEEGCENIHELRCFNRDAMPICFECSASLRIDDSYRMIGLTKTKDGEARVSTVWLGFDHSHSEEGPPLIFETMVFGGEWDSFQWRYYTETQALMGHSLAVKCLQSGLSPQEEFKKMEAGS